MDELIFAGNKYISSKRAGKIAGYTTDYLGQMCREEKMDCRFVGRNWYINERELEKQKKSFKKEQLNEDKRAIEYKKLELEPMYYSDDRRGINLEVNKVTVEDTEASLRMVDLGPKEGVREIEVKRETLIPILSMVESPMVDLRNTRKEIIESPVKETKRVIERKPLLPQKSLIKFPMVKVLASVIVLVGLLFVAGTFILQQTVHYTSVNGTVSTDFQIAGIGSLFNF